MSLKPSSDVMPSKRQSGEMFVQTPRGRSDAALHEPILAGGSREAEKIGRAVAERIGLSTEEIKLLFPGATAD